MATTYLTGFESGDLGEIAGSSVSSGGSISAQSTTKRSGSYALQLTSTTTGIAFAALNFNSDGSGPGPYIRFYFQFAALPASGREVFYMQLITGGSSDGRGLALNSAGHIALVANNSGFTEIATGTTVLAPNTWYEIGFSYVTGTYNAYINGNLEFTGTTLSGTYFQTYIGKSFNTSNTAVTYYFDDICISDSAIPGPGQVAVLLPNGAGNYSQFKNQTQTGNGLFSAVNDLPNDGATSFIITPTSAGTTKSTFTINSLAGSNTINGVKVMAYGEAGTFPATSPVCQPMIRTSATDSIDPITTINITSQALYKSVFYVFPTDGTGTGWTNTALNATEIGIQRPSSNNQQLNITAIYAMVDYQATKPIKWQTPVFNAVIIDDSAATSGNNTLTQLANTAAAITGTTNFNGSPSTKPTSIDNTTYLAFFLDLEIKLIYSSPPTTGGTFDIYILYTLDGSTYGGGTGGLSPTIVNSHYVMSIPLTNSSIQPIAIVSGIPIRPYKFQLQFVNNGSVSLAVQNSGSQIVASVYYEQYT